LDILKRERKKEKKQRTLANERTGEEKKI